MVEGFGILTGSSGPPAPPVASSIISSASARPSVARNGSPLRGPRDATGTAHASRTLTASAVQPPAPTRPAGPNTSKTDAPANDAAAITRERRTPNRCGRLSTPAVVRPAHR